MSGIISKERLEKLAKRELIQLALLLTDAKTKATESRLVAENNVRKLQEEKDEMRTKALDLLKRCRTMQVEKQALVAHLSSYTQENQELNNELSNMRNEIIQIKDKQSNKRNRDDGDDNYTNNIPSEVDNHNDNDNDLKEKDSNSNSNNFENNNYINKHIQPLEEDVKRYRLERDMYRSLVDKTLPKIQY